MVSLVRYHGKQDVKLFQAAVDPKTPKIIKIPRIDNGGRLVQPHKVNVDHLPAYWFPYSSGGNIAAVDDDYVLHVVIENGSEGLAAAILQKIEHQIETN